MKTLILLFLLALNFNILGQSNRTLDLHLFLDKKIVSNVKIFTHENDTRNSGGCCLFAQATTKMIITKMFKLNKKNSNEIIVMKELSRLTAEFDKNYEGGDYDSDNSFDRESSINIGYSQFDKMVKKPLQYHFNFNGKRLDTLKSELSYEDSYLDKIFNGQVFTHYLNYYWSEVFQIPVPSTLEVGAIFKDHYLGVKSDLINNYTVVSIKNNEILLKIKGVRIPKKILEEKRFDTKEFISGRNIYEGTILFDSNNMMIKELNINNRRENTNYNTKGSFNFVESQDISIQNNLQDI